MEHDYRENRIDNFDEDSDIRAESRKLSRQRLDYSLHFSVTQSASEQRGANLHNLQGSADIRSFLPAAFVLLRIVRRLYLTISEKGETDLQMLYYSYMTFGEIKMSCI